MSINMGNTAPSHSTLFLTCNAIILFYFLLLNLLNQGLDMLSLIAFCFITLLTFFGHLISIT
jgi:hypothetical protein